VNPLPGPVWITGAGGLIGSHLLATAPFREPRCADLRPASSAGVPPVGVSGGDTPAEPAAGDGCATRVRGLTRADTDLTDFATVRNLFRHDSPALLIHCAGLTTTAGCEKDHAFARRVNVEATAHLAELAADIPFIFFSTDLVFDGKLGHYDETAPVGPLTFYGETKVAAEEIVLANPRHTVVRTSLNFGRSPGGNHSFNEQLCALWAAGRTLKLFVDEFRSPIAAVATARALWELAALNRPGLYHLAGAERLSRWDIGCLLAARYPDLNARLERTSLSEYQGPPRSADTSLNCAKIQPLLPTPLPRFSEWIKNAPANA
jgi:dTDP-4-dehydrorhamnose reductase